MKENTLPEVKKRGRKKKVIEGEQNIIEFLPKEEEKIPKKRGRKARGAKLIIKSDENINSDKNISSANVILHLKCCSADLNEYNNEIKKMVSDPLIYNPIIPPNVTSYNDNNTFTSYKEDENTLNEKLQLINETENIPILWPFNATEYLNNTTNVNTCNTSNTCNCHSESQLQTKELNMKLKKLKIALYKNNIPNDKISACFWCSYDFDNSPCYIPKHEVNNTMYGYGSFCRPECAVAYLFKENIDDSTKFERYHLLNNLYGKVYDYKNNIKPAPDPHYLLDKFYGQLSIQEYRKLLKTQHMLSVIDKPMTRILPELHDDNDDPNYSAGSKTGVYKVKRESEREQGPSKTSIIRDKFGLSA